MVTFEIDIHHLVKGMHFGDQWVNYTILWHKKYFEKLPVYTKGLSFDQAVCDSKIRRTWLIRLKHERLSINNKFRWLSSIKVWRYPSSWPYIVLFLLRKTKKL